MQELLTEDIKRILESASQSWGLPFFQTMTAELGQSICADFVFIGKVDSHRTGVDTLGLWGDGKHLDDFYYDLENTPCKNVSDNSVCIYKGGVTGLFPKDELLIQMGIEGYIGTPLKNSRGQVFALLVALFKNEIDNSEYIKSLFEVFAGRISAELEREEREKQLMELNETLDDRVKRRTIQLEQTNIHLKNVIDQLEKTRDQLIENERLASLGTLVAGVAHEVNTPLGVAMSASSAADVELKNLHKAFENQSLRKSEFQRFFDVTEEAFTILISNLERSAGLIRNFKKLAADQTSYELQQVNFCDYINEILLTLKPIFSEKRIAFTNSIDPDFQMETDAGALYQIFTNLFVNAIECGYEPDESGWVEVTSHYTTNGIEILVRNGGKSIAESVRSKIFDPFVTSRRGSGGTGLGLNIAYNLVHKILKGNLSLTEWESPVCFTISIPESAYEK